MFVCRTEKADRVTSGHRRPLAETSVSTECELTDSELMCPICRRMDRHIGHIGVPFSQLCVFSPLAAKTFIAATSSRWRRSALQAFLPVFFAQAFTKRICRQLMSIHHLGRATR